MSIETRIKKIEDQISKTCPTCGAISQTENREAALYTEQLNSLLAEGFAPEVARHIVIEADPKAAPYLD